MQVNESPIEAVMNLFEAALIILVPDPEDPEAAAASSSVSAHVQSTIFDANERGLTFLGSFASATVTDCTFTGNAAMHAGAGLLVHVNPTNPPVNVTGCRFVRNAAGYVDVDAFAAYADSFRVHDDEVFITHSVDSWRRGLVVKMSVFGWRTFPDLCLIYG